MFSPTHLLVLERLSNSIFWPVTNTEANFATAVTQHCSIRHPCSAIKALFQSCVLFTTELIIYLFIYYITVVLCHLIGSPNGVISRCSCFVFFNTFPFSVFVLPFFFSHLTFRSPYTVRASTHLHICSLSARG